ncbi:MAG TPA: metallophosphoesterase, partial [Candidatus Sumerlaeota bacterium]|nr:metallophosphoesterase [Candidatus Sumerlaeota bacterium]
IVVVLSGDITQRARRAQFRAARTFVDRLAAPVLAIPGNHDLPLFSHGTIKIAQYEITVDLNNASFNENENVKREVASRINDMPEFERGAKVMDFTRMDSRKVPRMLELETPK